MHRLLIGLAAFAGFAAVALGAAGAHLIDPGAIQARAWLDTALDYAGWHAAALLAVGLSLRGRSGGAGLIAAAGAGFALGLVLFSGSLALLAFGAPGWLTGVTPLGGMAFLAGWALMAAWALRR